MSVIVGLFLRALRICDPHKLDEENNFIKNSFKELAYPAWFIDRAISKARRIFYGDKEEKQLNKENKKVITLPYMPTMKEVTSKINDQDYKFAFRYQNTIRNKLCKNKLTANENTQQGEGGGVYVIDCMDCQEKYVGETGRGLEIRLREHKGAVTRNSPGSAVAKHCWEKDHRMDFRNSKMVFKNNNISHRRVVEGALIRELRVVDGNKAFTTEDPFSRRLILREARVKTDKLGISTSAQQVENITNNPDQEINIPSNQEINIPPQHNPAQANLHPRNHNIRTRTATRHSRRIRGIDPD